VRAAVAVLSRHLTSRRADPGWVPLRRNRPGLRRLLTAGLLAAATAAALHVVAPDPTPGRTVVVATRDVPAGAALQASDVAVTAHPAEQVPASAAHRLADVVGRVVAAPLSAREVVTTTRLVGPNLLLGRTPDQVAAPVRIADAGAAALLRAGVRVDVLVAVEGADTARTVARGATVLARPVASGDGLGSLGTASDSGGGLVLLAVSDSDAAALAQSAAAGALSVVIR
jgi:pilus assembly protein CpaB